MNRPRLRRRGFRRGVFVAGVVVVALAVTGGVAVVAWPDRGSTRVTAHFDRAVGLYPGSDVRILGVKVGEVDSVTPRGRTVRVVLSFDAEHKVPADARAAVVARSLVSDRYVQFTPVYEGGPVLADGATLPVERTMVPVELDETGASLNQLTKALGPEGANRDGSLSRLLGVGAENFQGQGADVRATIDNVAKVSATLSENSGTTVDTIRNLDRITQAMARSDQEIRAFNRNLAAVADQLDAEGTELRTALGNLQATLADVSGFVRTNRKDLSDNVRALTKVTASLVENKKSVEKFLDTAPLALHNAMNAYNPVSRSLQVRVNLHQTNNIARWVCSLSASIGAPQQQCENILKPLNAAGMPLDEIGVDTSWITGMISHYEPEPPPPDAYGPNSRPSGNNGQAGQQDEPTRQDPSDPSLGGILRSPEGSANQRG